MEENNYKDQKALVLFSGGQDSTTCLGWALNRFDKVEALSFVYGQRHEVELHCAKRICEKLNIHLTVLDISFFRLIADSNLLNRKGNVSEPHPMAKDLPSSWVPNRNAMFLTIGHTLAIKLGFDALIIGVSAVDYSGYPDCRIEFILSMEIALMKSSLISIDIVTPLIESSKADIWKMAEDEGVLEIVRYQSHTCYEGVRSRQFDWGYGCGECPACILRDKGYDKYIT